MMRRSISSAIVVFIRFCCARCTRYVDPPLPEAQRLLMAHPWILVYTDSVSIDSPNIVIHHLIPASACEKQEKLSFGNNFNYYIQLVCGQSVPVSFNGDWNFLPDSSLGFGLKTDTGVFSSLNIAKLEMVIPDTLKLVQEGSFASPGIPNQLFFEKTYSR
jgi:hypothetical protein